MEFRRYIGLGVVIVVAILVAPSAFAAITGEEKEISLSDLPHKEYVQGTETFRINWEGQRFIAVFRILNASYVSYGSGMDVSGKDCVFVTLVYPSEETVTVTSDGGAEVDIWAVPLYESVNLSGKFDGFREFVIMGEMRNVYPFNYSSINISHSIWFSLPTKGYVLNRSYYSDTFVFWMNAMGVVMYPMVEGEEYDSSGIFVAGGKNYCIDLLDYDSDEGDGGGLPPEIPEFENITARAGDEIYFSAYRVHDWDGYITNVSWDFGDGVRSEEINVTHIYTSPGIYNVTLTVWDNDSLSNSTSFRVHVLPAAVDVNFSYSISANTVEFRALCSGNNYTWYFGDGSTGYGRNVSHTYRYPGRYRVELVVDDTGFAVREMEIGEFRPSLPSGNYVFHEDSVNISSYVPNVTDDYDGAVFFYGGNNSSYAYLQILNIPPEISMDIRSEFTLRAYWIGYPSVKILFLRNDEIVWNATVQRFKDYEWNLSLSYDQNLGLLAETRGGGLLYLSFRFGDGNRTDIFAAVSRCRALNLNLSAILVTQPLKIILRGYDANDRVFGRILVNGDAIAAGTAVKNLSLNTTVLLDDGIYTIKGEIYDDDLAHVSEEYSISVERYGYSPPYYHDKLKVRKRGDCVHIKYGHVFDFVIFGKRCVIYHYPRVFIVSIYSPYIPPALPEPNLEIYANSFSEGSDIIFISDSPVNWYFSDGFERSNASQMSRKFWHAGNHVVFAFARNFAFRSFTVENVLPSVNVSIPSNITEGVPFRISANVSEFGYAESYIYVDSRYISYGSAILSLGAGEHTISVKVVDDEHSIIWRNFSVNVENVPPTLLTHDFFTSMYTPVILSAVAYDFSDFRILWYLNGSLISEGNYLNLSYLAAGEYFVSVKVTDYRENVWRDFTLRIHKDVDSDGMDDLWEREYSLNIGEDDSREDYDSDDVVNILEYHYCLNPRNPDTDGDGLSDYQEITLGTSGTSTSTDSDGLSDYEEIYDFYLYMVDRPRITLNTSWTEFRYDMPSGLYRIVVGYRGNIEVRNGTNVSVENNTLVFYITAHSPLLFYLRSTSGFALVDEIYIYRQGINPYSSDTDGDLLPDDLDPYPASVDGDNDGLSDFFEVQIGTNVSCPDSDHDANNLSIGYDSTEILAGISPLDTDSDNDGLNDSRELSGWAYSEPMEIYMVSLPVPLWAPGYQRYEIGWRCTFYAPVFARYNLIFPYGGYANVDGKDYGNTSVVSVYLKPGYHTAKIYSIITIYEPSPWEISSPPYPPWIYVKYGNASYPTADLKINCYGLNPLSNDTDADGLSDSCEVEMGSSPLSEDFDHDGLSDSFELSFPTEEYHLNPLSNDTDDDGLSDYKESSRFSWTSPILNDTDMDGINDGDELRYWNKTRGLDNITAWRYCAKYDVDSDTMPDGWEIGYSLDPMVDDAYDDYDGDGLSNVGEWNFHSSPVKEDTDEDRLNDWAEIMGVEMRTNIRNGALSASYYRNLNSSSWLWINSLNFGDIGIGNVSFNFSRYEVLNSTIPEENASFFLIDGRSGAYPVWGENGDLLLYVGPVYTYVENNTTKYVYASFMKNDKIDVVWGSEPKKGFRDREIPLGTLPTRKDSDSDGIYDYEYLVHSPPMQVAYIHDKMLLKDYDSDKAADKYESYVLFRLDPTWRSLAIELRNWSAVIGENLPTELVKFAYTGHSYSSLPSGCKAIGMDYWNRPIYIKGDYLYYDLGEHAPPDERYVEYVRNSSAGISTSPFPLENLVAMGYEVHYIPDSDNDDTPDLGDVDSDNDGIEDGTEPLYWYDLDGDSLIGMRDTDSDSDGIEDGVEDANHNGSLDSEETSPVRVDTDGDGLLDGYNVVFGYIMHFSMEDEYVVYRKVSGIFNSSHVLKALDEIHYDDEGNPYVPILFVGEKNIEGGPIYPWEYDTDRDMLSDSEESFPVFFEGNESRWLHVDEDGRYYVAPYKTGEGRIYLATILGEGESINAVFESNISSISGNPAAKYMLHVAHKDGSVNSLNIEICRDMMGNSIYADDVYLWSVRSSDIRLNIGIREGNLYIYDENHSAILDTNVSMVYLSDMNPFLTIYSYENGERCIIRQLIFAGYNLLHSFTSPVSNDTDGDGLIDGEEYLWGALPTTDDTDGDEISDYSEVYPVEIVPTSKNPSYIYPSYPYRKDSDYDGLSDKEERDERTNPLKNDTDEDYLGDYYEVNYLPTSPLIYDTDEDGLADGVEINPNVRYGFVEYRTVENLDPSQQYLLYISLVRNFTGDVIIHTSVCDIPAHAEGRWVYAGPISFGVSKITISYVYNESPLNHIPWRVAICIPVNEEIEGFEWDNGMLVYASSGIIYGGRVMNIDLGYSVLKKFELSNATIYVEPVREYSADMKGEDGSYTGKMDIPAEIHMVLIEGSVETPTSGVDVRADVTITGYIGGEEITIDKTDINIPDSGDFSISISCYVEDKGAFLNSPMTVNAEFYDANTGFPVSVSNPKFRTRLKEAENFRVEGGDDYEEYPITLPPREIQIPLYGVARSAIQQNSFIRLSVGKGIVSYRIVLKFRYRVSDPLCRDSDADGVIDGAEYYYNTSLLSNDTDNDYLSDYGELSVLDRYCARMNQTMTDHINSVLNLPYRKGAIWNGTSGDVTGIFVALTEDYLNYLESQSEGKALILISVKYTKRGEFDSIIFRNSTGAEFTIKMDKHTGMGIMVVDFNGMYSLEKSGGYEIRYLEVKDSEMLKCVDFVSLSGVLKDKPLSIDFGAEITDTVDSIDGVYRHTIYAEGTDEVDIFTEMGVEQFGYYGLMLNLTVGAYPTLPAGDYSLEVVIKQGSYIVGHSIAKWNSSTGTNIPIFVKIILQTALTITVIISGVIYNFSNQQTSGSIDIRINRGTLFGQWVGTSAIDDDCDNDLLIDGADIEPLISDMDGDGLIDGVEIIIGTNPNDADTDKDGLSDGDEVLHYGTDPLDADSDDDGLIDGVLASYPEDLNSTASVYNSTALTLNYTYLDLGWSTVYAFNISEIHVQNSTGIHTHDIGASYTEKKAVGEMLIHTDPFIPDEDCDYAMDGAEIYYAVFNDTHLTLNISVKDTDEDGIEDGPEVYAFFYAYAVNYAEGNRSYWANPMKDDAYNDSDSDGLANIEEWERSGYRMDYDRDTIPNFYDLDDDGDKLPTSVELGADLNSFNPRDAHGDKDSDGLDNLWEYENGTMITDADTDHDGINDGAELYYWNVTRGIPNETAVDYLKDPDVDKDNVTDGKEINGWTVKIIVGYDEENKPISKEVTLYGDPLAPYKNETGAYIDSDEDNIPDVVESLLSNNSTFLKFARMFADPDSVYYNKSLWENYSWCIAYFYSIALDKSFSEIKQNIDTNPIHWIPEYEDELKSLPNSAEVKNRTENATQWLRDEFNPIIVESMSPVITQFIAVTDVGCFYAYTKVTVELRDPSGIGEIILKSQPEKDVPLIYDIRIFNGSGEKIWSVENLKLNITAGSSLWHYYVVCNATDLLNNTAEWNKEIKGIVKLIVDTVAKALSMLWGFLCEIGKILAKAFEILIEWLINMVKTTINVLLSPLINAINNWNKELVLTVKEGWDEYNNTGTITKDTLNKFNELLGGTLFWILLGISVGLLTLSLTLNALTFGSMTIISTVIAPVVTLAILAVFSITEEKRISLDLSGVSLSVDSIWNFVVNLITGGSSSRKVLFEEFAAILDVTIKEWLEIVAIWLKNAAIWIEGIYMGKLGGHIRESISFVFGFLSVLLASIGIITHNKIISIIAIAFGIAGLVLGFGVSLILKIQLKLHSIVANILGIIGVGIAIYTVLMEG